MRFRFSFGQAAAMYLTVLGFLLVVFVAALISGTTFLQDHTEGEPGRQSEADKTPPVISTFPGETEQPAAPLPRAAADLDQARMELPQSSGPERGPGSPSSDTQPADSGAMPRPASGEESQESLLPPALAQEEDPVDQAAPPPAGSFTIQVAAHSTQEEASQTLSRLRISGFQGSIRHPKPGDPDRLIRVWVGSFPSIEAARPLERELKDAGFQTYIRRVN
jgi:cell division septation protein DedD